MNRSIFLAALATLASGAALAQSNVTIYGRLNESVEYQKPMSGVDRIWAVQDNSSRIGFKGTEDLGGGLKAFFVIESGFSADTGMAAGRFWGRESDVGLMGNFGTVRLGNVGQTAAYYAIVDAISMHNHDTGTSSDAFYIATGAPTNTIAYATPNMSGFSAEFQYGLKSAGLTEQKADPANDTITLVGKYDGGPLHFAASYVDGQFAGNRANTPAQPIVGTNSAKQFGLRASYDFGPFTVGAYYMNDRWDLGAGPSAKRNSYRLSGMYTLGASEFHLNFGYADKFKAGDSVLIDKATQATIAYNYNLSKRTKVYAFYTAISGDGKDAYAGNVGAVNSFAVGLRHNF